MTSDHSLDPFLRQLETYSDEIFRGQPAPRNELDPATRKAVQRLRAIDRIPPLDQARMQSRKDELMSFTTSWPPITEPFRPTARSSNGKHPVPVPLPTRPAIAPQHSLMLPFISAAVLIALVGGLIFGIMQNRGGPNEPTLPAYVQGSPSPQNSPALGSNWGQTRGGLDRTGFTSDPGPGSTLNLLWSVTPQEWVNGIVEEDGTIFGFGDQNGLYAIDAVTGTLNWSIDLGDGQWALPDFVPAPAVVDGTVYVSTSNGLVAAVDATSGAVLWQQSVGNPTLWEPTVADGRVYVSADESRLVALDATTGAELWSWDYPGGIMTQFPTIADGTLFIADFSDSVYAIDLATGKMLWDSEPIAAVRTSAYRDGTLYVPGWDGRMTALDTSDGSVRWTSTDATGSAVMAPVLTDSALIAVTDLGTARALDPATGAELWSIPASGVTHPPYASGDTLYLETMPGVFTAVDLATGERIGRTEGIHGAGSTVVISGNMLFVSGVAGPIRAFVPYVTTPIDITAGTPAPALMGTPTA